MLTKLKLHNYRTFLNAEIDFTRRHLLIGRNNSGKTNLTSAIRFLGATSNNDLATAMSCVPGGILEMRNWHSKSDEIEMSCTCELEYEGQPCEFKYDLVLRIQQSTDPLSGPLIELHIVHERLLLDSRGFDSVVLLENDGHEAKMCHERHLSDGHEPYTPKTLSPANATMLSKLYELDTNRRAILFRTFLSAWSYYLLSPESMRLGWRTQVNVFGALDVQGSLLANAIFQLKNVDELRYRRLIEHTSIIEPELKAINFVPAPDQGAVPSVVVQNQPRASWAGLSDGTLRTLAIAYIIEMSGVRAGVSGLPPALVIIEEPENGLYPGQLRAIFDLFEEWAPEGQFIFTSHSPYFINFFDATRESVTILRRSNDRTEIDTATPLTPDDASPDRLTLADKYGAGLLD